MFEKSIGTKKFKANYIDFWNDLSSVMQFYKPRVCVGGEVRVFNFGRGIIVYSIDYGSRRENTNFNIAEQRIDIYSESFFKTKKGKTIKKTINTLLEKYSV